jgi:serine/threonine-protein kinase PknG
VSQTCAEPDCTGTIQADGYCDTCGVAAVHGAASSVSVQPAEPRPGSSKKIEKTTRTRRGGTTRTTSMRPGLAGGLVEFPPVKPRDPATSVMPDPYVPEERRHCANCDSSVGRGHNGEPGRTEGFCRQCGQPFSFTPKLAAGDVVANQYEVVGCLTHGGLGWIYLARDRNVIDRWVVLKGLLNTGDDDARAAALAERRFLAEVKHPNIVVIHNFVEHDEDGYIVMEFVDGKSLREILQERRAENGGASSPLPVAQAIGYILEILPALGQLHELGLLFCDFKPDNVMQTANGFKLIDLGGVYSLDAPSSAIFGTAGFQAPEIAQTGPTVASDLFTVARTLAVLCTNFRGYQTTYRYTLPEPSEMPELAAHDSLYRLLRRATATDPDDRFQSVDEMSAQLVGVLREIVADEKGVPQPGPSSVFTGEQRGEQRTADWHVLPALLVSTDDPAAGFLATIAAGLPEATLDALRHAPEPTVEVELRIARTLIENGRSDEARRALDEITDADPWEWRADWYRALDALARDDGVSATQHFFAVYGVVPGELAPKLGLAMAAESAQNWAEAAFWYDVVSRTDSSLTSACFGLARSRVQLGDRAGAVAALDRVPERSSAHLLSQVAQAETMLDGAGTTDVARAAEVIDGIALTGEPRAQLHAKLFEAGLAAVCANENDPVTGAPMILGYPLDENGMRSGLEASYRALARYSPSTDERIRLVDHANRVRPRTLV